MANIKYGTYASSKQFPDNFLLGTATSAYQVEGAWNEDKSASFWDEYFHNQEQRKYKYSLDMPLSVIEKYKKKGVQPKLVDIYKGMGVYEVPKTAVVVDDINYDFNGDVAADTYHKTDTDVKLLKELGVQVYRFSLSPNRIVPDVHDHLPGHKGIDYYNNLINKLIENGIIPMVSLYYFDLSAKVLSYGGQINSIDKKFYLQYAKLCFENFGDRVKYWTVAPDLQLTAEGYGSEHFAPGKTDKVFSGFLDYVVLHNMLTAVATISKVYNEEYKNKQHGEISLTINGTWFYPQDPNNPEHQKSAEFARLSTFGMILHALSTGQYPAEVVEAIEKNSKIEKLSVGRLNQFTKEEQAHVKGSFDFIVFNYYGSVKVRPLTEKEIYNEPNLKSRDRGYFMNFENITQEEIYEGFFNCLKYINKTLKNPKIFIGENGFPENEGVDDSHKKIAYHTGILNKLLEALDENINVFGYCVWSFIDTLEFTFGYSKKFGIYKVDFNDPSRPRSKKNSFPFFQNLFQTKKL